VQNFFPSFATGTPQLVQKRMPVPPGAVTGRRRPALP